MLTLYQFTDSQSQNLSPFAFKVETFLKLAQIPFQVKAANVLKAPRRKLPFIKDGETMVTDSTLIVDYLVKKFNIDWDRAYSEEKRAIGHAVTIMAQEHLALILIYIRWVKEDVWQVSQNVFFAGFSGIKRKILPPLAHRHVRKTLFYQGLGRHSEEDLFRFADEDLASISHIIGENKFLLGPTLSSYDAMVYSILKNIQADPFSGILRDMMQNYPNLLSYLKNIEACEGLC